jgi:ubiquinone/menaquinone biosynthesis C-methylase UbiE
MGAAHDARSYPATDYEAMAARYDAGREIPLESLIGWRDALKPYLSPAPRRPVLDLGSGTGLWSVALAGWFGVRVVAVEPSQAMLHEATTKRRRQQIAYVRGVGERIPLRDQSCAVAWLSTVVHHIRDLPGCAGELRRVLVPGSPVLVRNAFPGRSDDILWPRFFPQAAEIAANIWPRLDLVTDSFASAGFQPESVQQVPQVSARSLREYVDRIRTRADSTLQLLDDDEFDRGVAELERAAAAQTTPHPVVDRLDLVVFR